MAGEAREKLEAGQLWPGGQRRALHEDTLHGGGSVACGAREELEAGQLQVADGAKDELEADQV